MLINEVLQKDDLNLLKTEWDILQQSDPNGNPKLDARGPQKYNPRRLAKLVGMNNPDRFQDFTSSKPEVKSMEQSDMGNLRLLFHILAWGGISNRANNPMILYKKLKSDKTARTQLLKALKQIRSGGISNADAFDLFQSMRKNGYLPGLGVSYFTKVLYFMRPNKGAYILDQFTAKGMNYLHSKDPSYPEIRMGGDEGANFPSNNLTGKEYEAYNKGIERLTTDLQQHIKEIGPEQAEFLLFNPWGGGFRDKAGEYHSSRTDLKKDSTNKYKYIQRARKAQQEKQPQPTNTLAGYMTQAQSLWNQHMEQNTKVAQKFRSLSSDTKLDFQQEFIDDVASALRNNETPNAAIVQLLQNYNNISEG